MGAIYLNNDNLLTLPSLTKKSDNSAVTNATVTVQLYLPDYVTTVGSPVTLNYVANTPSEYQGTLPHAAAQALAETAQYVANVVADSGGLHLDMWCPLICERFTGGN